MRLCIFCGSNVGTRPAYRAAAESLGTLLASQGIGVVYGGARVGLMGAVADAALAAGGEVIGVIPRALRDKEIAHDGLTALHVVGSMHERKAMMADLADGFVALPGGVGTYEELFEVWTWAQLGFHAKPVALLDAEGFYLPLTAFLDRAVVEGFVRAPHRDMLVVEQEPAALLERLRAYRGPVVEKWLDRGST